ncbi:Gfo/Idh/MocA family oxidoreductase [Brevibacillus sp. FSL K6-0770]|uniref:Gfo/Idh/MocA family oxidoreductase n=1 Tax=Brevibacillus TaxID=55080 RepID=UPI000EDA720C|nr:MULTISPECIES: Gfo/Idh/MocA family oxidoreductase [Brevibacillus]MDR4997940.1 Gfo/Idh/MocA family oxidoreductase [Brevibacillus parabrevis]HBZ81742.1 hypothetical protein [Brevibacillus sp.]
MKTIGIVGLGPMGLRYVEVMKKMEQIKLAVVDLRQEAIQQVKERQLKHEVVAYSSHADMLQHEQLDVLIIATNGPSHYPIYLDAVKHGVKRIICEKPIATSIAQAREMVEIARAEGITLAVNHGRRWSKDYVSLREKLRSGIIGSVESIMFSMGGGQMGCNGTHFIDLAGYLLEQNVVQVCGFLNDENIANPRGANFKDPGGYAIVHFEAGARMFFEMAEDLGIPPLMVINGKCGRVTINEIERFYLIETRNEDDWALPVTRYGTPLRRVEKEKLELDIHALSHDLLQAVFQDEAPADPEYAVKALEAVIGIHLSHEKGNKQIALPIADEECINRLFKFT